MYTRLPCVGKKGTLGKIDVIIMVTIMVIIIIIIIIIITNNTCTVANNEYFTRDYLYFQSLEGLDQVVIITQEKPQGNFN